MRRFPIVTSILAAALAVSAGPARALDAHSDILAGHYNSDTEDFDSLESINSLVGADIFYAAGYLGQHTIIANVEAGLVWGGHEVFDRTGLGLPSTPAVSIFATPDADSPDLGQVDFHATMVGHVLAGTGLRDDGQLSTLGAGMAPYATLWSGAIATSFNDDPDHTGEFEISDESFLLPYKTFFEGSLGQKPDVINSSWGFDDPSGTSKETRILDALAATNPSVTFVKSAGNGGADSAPGGPGSGYNGITVGSLGGLTGALHFLTPSDFSSSKPADFYNPQTGVTLTGVRAAVDIAAPGEELVLAAYLGKSGSLAGRADIIGPDGNPATDQYFLNMAGTSFSSPIVAGGVALLKDVSYSDFYFADQPNARDTRVIKSVLLAGAAPTVGWDNGQHLVGGVVTTSQGLDYATGAGALDLTSAVLIYIGGTADVPGQGGGSIQDEGWDMGTVARGIVGPNDYFFDLSFAADTWLTVSLNWFVERQFDDATGDASEQSFANLDLQVWSVTAGLFTTKIAESASLYNNSEFLRLLLHDAGSYGLRVTFDDVAYDLTGALTSEPYAIAWKTSAVPEPATWGVIIAVALIVMAVDRRRRLSISDRTR